MLCYNEANCDCELWIRTGAAKDLQEVLKFKPDSAEAHFELAKLKAIQGLGLKLAPGIEPKSGPEPESPARSDRSGTEPDQCR